MEHLLNKALQTLMHHCREELDSSALKLETAQEHLLEIQLEDLDKDSIKRISNHLNLCL